MDILLLLNQKHSSPQLALVSFLGFKFQENLIGRRLTDLILTSNAEMVRRTLQLSQDDRDTLDALSNSEDPESLGENAILFILFSNQ